MNTLIALALSASAATAPATGGAQRETRVQAEAKVAVEILRPAVVRGGKADERTLDRGTLARRDGRVFVEFQ